MSALVMERWNARLENWALWLVAHTARASGSPYPAYRLFRARSRGDSAPARPCALVGAALDTDRLVVELARESPARAEAVRVWYVWTGTYAERAAAIGVHPDTLRDRVVAACHRLEELSLLRARYMAAAAVRVA